MSDAQKNQIALAVNAKNKTRLVCGIGINDGSYPACINFSRLREYELWKSMLREIQLHGVGENLISESFKNYSFFYEWVREQKGFNSNGWVLTKSVVKKNNNTYSEDNCFFVPAEIFHALRKRKTPRDGIKIGVRRQKSGARFVASFSTNSVSKAIPFFKTEEDAFQVYKSIKESYLKELAEKYKGEIDGRAYEALTQYEVDEND